MSCLHPTREAHSIEGIFCRISRNSKGYRVWIPKQRKFIKARDVIIYEKFSSIAEPDDNMIAAQSEGVQEELSTPTATPSPDLPEEPGLASVAAPSDPVPPERTPEIRVRPTRTSRPTWKVKYMEGTTPQ